MQSVKTFSTVILVVVVVFALFKCWFVCSFASKIWLFDVHVLLKLSSIIFKEYREYSEEFLKQRNTEIICLNIFWAHIHTNNIPVFSITSI